MAANPVYDKIWVEDAQRVRETVDARTLKALLGSGLPKRLERRGSAVTLKFRAVYDRYGRYEAEAVLLRSRRGVVAVLQEDLYRIGDPFYIEMNRKVFRFRVERVRNGTRPGDQDLTRVLELALD